MTKADIVSNISKNLGIEKIDVQLTVESVMKEIISSLENGENVYLRGFGSFIVKKRAEKKGRNIKNNTTIKIPFIELVNTFLISNCLIFLFYIITNL